MNRRPGVPRIVVALAVAAISSIVRTATMESKPPLAEYFEVLPPRSIALDYAPDFISAPYTADLDGDGNEDLVVLGINLPLDGRPVNVPQPGLVFLGDGNGNFSLAPSERFPVDTLKTVNARKVLFGDFNGDGQLDMFVASHGWDTDPFPGEQNRLFLSRAGGGWRDATSELPQLGDYSHTAAIGDIRGRGTLDVVVGNYFAPPPNRVLSYALLNNGSGQFTLSREVIPVAADETMDPESGHYLLGLTLADLDGDGLPELIVTGDATDSTKKLRRTTVLWNRAGAFHESSKTELPEPSALPTHIDLDAQAIDLNRDGLLDLVVVGSHGQPFYDGWFVQLLINRGDGTFADVTADRLAAGDRLGGRAGVATGTPYATWVKVLDFNGDGFPDFAVEYSLAPFSSIEWLPRSTPLIYLNDGTGHFSTLKVSDFVAPGNESAVGYGHLIRTRNGYGFVTLALPPWLPRQGLVLTGLAASKPFRLRRPERPEFFDVRSSGSSVALTWFAPASGSAASEYIVEAGSAPGLTDLANFQTGTASTAFFASGVPSGRYYVRVRSFGIAGRSAPSNEVAHVVSGIGDGCGSPPSPPSLSASASGSTVALSWTASTGATNYVLEAGSGSGESNVASINVGGVPGFVANGVGAGVYHVKVRAGNSCGIGMPSNELAVTVR